MQDVSRGPDWFGRSHLPWLGRGHPMYLWMKTREGASVNFWPRKNAGHGFRWVGGAFATLVLVLMLCPSVAACGMRGFRRARCHVRCGAPQPPQQVYCIPFGYHVSAYPGTPGVYYSYYPAPQSPLVQWPTAGQAAAPSASYTTAPGTTTAAPAAMDTVPPTLPVPSGTAPIIPGGP